MKLVVPYTVAVRCRNCDRPLISYAEPPGPLSKMVDNIVGRFGAPAFMRACYETLGPDCVHPSSSCWAQAGDEPGEPLKMVCEECRQE